jgi:hypothetical protein
MNNSPSWSNDIEDILESIRKNSTILSEEHRKQYFYLKSYLKYFRIPTIFLSAVNSVASVGLVNYVKQEKVSLITCLIALTTGIITSIELFLNLEQSMNNELEKYKDFYLLSIDIFKTLQLNRDNRNIDGSTYLEQSINLYSKLHETSNVLTNTISDKLTNIDHLSYKFNKNPSFVDLSIEHIHPHLKPILDQSSIQISDDKPILDISSNQFFEDKPIDKPILDISSHKNFEDFHTPIV